MQQTFPPVTTSLYLNERQNWMREIKRGDNVTVLFLPKTDRFRRLLQLMEDKTFLTSFFGSKKRYLFQFADFNVGLVEDRFDIQEHISRELNISNISSTHMTFDQWMSYLNKNNIRLVLILPDAEKYLTPENRHILSLLFYVSAELSPYITILSCFEVDVKHPSYLPILYSSKDIFENIFYYPLYSFEDTHKFFQYLKNKWEMTISQSVEENIIGSCGGHFWLVKEAVRELLNTGRWSSDNEDMRFRLEAIYNSFLSSEQSVLRKIVTNQIELTIEELHSRKYLKQMNFLDSNNHILLELYQSFLKSHAKMFGELTLKDGTIALNNIPLIKFLSKTEHRVLKVFLKQKGLIISRDEIANHMWPTNTHEQYSDWAIDQLIARLRKRMIELSLPSTLIESVRGKGYRFNC